MCQNIFLPKVTFTYPFMLSSAFYTYSILYIKCKTHPKAYSMPIAFLAVTGLFVIMASIPCAFNNLISSSSSTSQT